MVYRPTQLSRALPAAAVALASAGRHRTLVIYAGAGIGLSEPTGLPSGAAVARAIHARLVATFPVLAGCDEGDLLAIADAVAGEPGGNEAIRRTSCAVAEFTTATPGFAHRVLAYLMLEGLVEVLTTNWDNCIERGVPDERVSAVVNASDLQQIVGCSVLKVHGCATQPITVLVTTADLTHPPSWVVDEVRSKVGNSIVVFVGIGDVADYVERRLREAVGAVGDVGNVRVVSPSIATSWSTSTWSGILPGLASEHRLAQSADEFLDDLASAHISSCFREIVQQFGPEERLRQQLDVAIEALERHDCETILRWLRRSAVVPRQGQPVLHAHPLPKLLAALGELAGDSFGLGPDGLVRIGDACYQTLVATAPTSWTRMWREASNRLEALVTQGFRPDAAPIFLLAGGAGTKPEATSLPGDLLGDGDPFDIVGGPTQVAPRCLTAEEVLTP